jgi:hypothetical protein
MQQHEPESNPKGALCYSVGKPKPRTSTFKKDQRTYKGQYARVVALANDRENFRAGDDAILL